MGAERKRGKSFSVSSAVGREAQFARRSCILGPLLRAKQPGSRSSLVRVTAAGADLRSQVWCTQGFHFSSGGCRTTPGSPPSCANSWSAASVCDSPGTQSPTGPRTQHPRSGRTWCPLLSPVKDACGRMPTLSGLGAAAPWGSIPLHRQHGSTLLSR